MLQPRNKLTHILLVAGPLRQGTLQLTRDFKSKNKSENIIAVGTGSARQLIKLRRVLTFCSGLKQTAGRPRNPLGPESVFGRQALPPLKCFFEQTHPW